MKPLRLCAAGGVALSVLAGAGCQGLDTGKVNDALRAKNLKQEQEIGSLRGLLANREATLAEVNAQLDARTPRVETLKAERLAQLFTAARVQIRPQTDVWDWQGDKKPDGYRVFLRVLTAGDEILPATGTLTIEAFDLALAEGSQRLGTWTFTPEEMKGKWYSALGSNYFAFNCPWQKAPAHADVTFKAQFIDALTGNVLVTQIHKDVKLADTVAQRDAGK